jgi:hypothetical protein
VTMTTLMPASWHVSTASGTPGRGGSMREMRPQKVKPAVKYYARERMGSACWWMTLNRKVGDFAFGVKGKPYGKRIDGQLQLSKRQHAFSSAEKG